MNGSPRLKRKALCDLFARLAHGGKVNGPEEAAILDGVALEFDLSVPACACPKCWLARVLDGIEDEFVADEAEGEPCGA